MTNVHSPILNPKRRIRYFFKFLNQVIKNEEIIKEYDPCRISNDFASRSFHLKKVSIDRESLHKDPVHLNHIFCPMNETQFEKDD